jgi:hypothetical protein
MVVMVWLFVLTGAFVVLAMVAINNSKTAKKEFKEAKLALFEALKDRTLTASEKERIWAEIKDIPLGAALADFASKIKSTVNNTIRK